MAPYNKIQVSGYYKIARHYYWGLKQVFRSMNHTAVIVVEGTALLLIRKITVFIVIY